MVSDNSFDSVASEIEKKELEANGSVTPQMYCQLLAIYLYQHDLSNAKFLWKRIPARAKTEWPELERVWTVGRAMWRRDRPATHAALATGQWSDEIAPVMAALREEVVKRATLLTCRAYTSISVSAAAALLGCAPEDIARLPGWAVEGDSAAPPRPRPPSPTPLSSEDQLAKLTDFVSFLEN